MKSRSPRNLAFWIAVLIALLFFMMGMGVILQWFPQNPLVVALSGLGVFILIYLILFYVFRDFIYNKIFPIYRVIRKSGRPGKKIKKALNAGNPIEKIYNEVDDWAKTKNTEIAQLKANAKFRQEFIGNVSHELKTPIFNIQGYILTLLEGGLDDPKIKHLYLEKAEKSIDRMIQIVQDLDYIARIESGELSLDYANFDLVGLVEEVFEMHEMGARKAEIKLLLNRRSDKPVMVYADRKRILVVLSNLVVNGIAYGRKGGWVKVDFMDMDKHLLVEVADNGISIAEADQKRIFERFYRVDKSRSREQGGTGLGLAIVKHFVEAHGHAINIRSEEGVGIKLGIKLGIKIRD